MGNLLQNPVARDLVRQIRNHDLTTLADPAGPHPQRPAAGFVHLPDVFPGGDDFCLSRKIRALDVLAEFINRRLRLIQQAYAGCGDFPNVMRRDIRGHTNGDTGGAIKQNMGQPGRKH